MKRTLKCAKQPSSRQTVIRVDVQPSSSEITDSLNTRVQARARHQIEWNTLIPSMYQRHDSIQWIPTQ